ncbi:MAG: hypothetical protein ACLU4N_08500 [Butyricimonas faecihominis]
METDSVSISFNIDRQGDSKRATSCSVPGFPMNGAKQSSIWTPCCYIHDGKATFVAMFFSPWTKDQKQRRIDFQRGRRRFKLPEKPSEMARQVNKLKWVKFPLLSDQTRTGEEYKVIKIKALLPHG